MNCTKPSLIDELKATIWLVSETESGAALTSAVQLLSDEKFYNIFDRIEESDEQAVQVFDGLILTIAQKFNINFNLVEYTNAVGNTFLLFYYESLRRRGIIEYPETRDLFVLDEAACKVIRPLN